MQQNLSTFLAMTLLVSIFTLQRLQAQTNTSYNLNSIPIGGTLNTAFGSGALFNNNAGRFNVANGYQALFSNTTGSSNVANGHQALFSNTTGSSNVANGYNALYYNITGYFNTGNGYAALYNNTTGSGNVANGYEALFYNTTGSGNVANGYYALLSNTTGSYNVANGYQALYSNTTGFYNVANGYDALSFNTTGSSNTANGYGALLSNTTGSNNVANGNQALLFNDTGSNNIATGVYALNSNTTGSNNTAIGDSALSSNSIGYNNTALGSFADITYDNTNSTFLGAQSDATAVVANSTALGYAAVVTADNQVRIGNTDVTSIGGQVDWTTCSDGRYKKNIREDVPGLAFINLLKPITYTLDVSGIAAKFHKAKPSGLAQPQRSSAEQRASNEKAKIRYTGFVAQEVEKAAQNLNYDFSGVDAPKVKDDLYGLRYSEFVVPLVKAVQELGKKNEELSKKNEELEARLQKLEALIALGRINNATTKSREAYLEQNTPNPFGEATTIRYHLPFNSTPAKVVITSVNGQVLKTFSVSSSERGSVTLQAGSIAAGVYLYSLWVNNQLVDTKKMIVH